MFGGALDAVTMMSDFYDFYVVYHAQARLGLAVKLLFNYLAKYYKLDIGPWSNIQTCIFTVNGFCQ